MGTGVIGCLFSLHSPNRAERIFTDERWSRLLQFLEDFKNAVVERISELKNKTSKKEKTPEAIELFLL